MSQPHQPAAPRPAAAVVLARPHPAGSFEVYMVRRHIKSEFVPDAFVFPGGSVSADDIAAETAAALCDGAPDGPTALGAGFRAAAIRECFEEAGVLLATRNGHPLAQADDDRARVAAERAALNRRETTLAEVAAREGLTLATRELLHWAHWITPPPFPKRFDTHFFLAPMPDGQQAAHDQLETSAGAWIRPADALARFKAGDFPIVFATIHQLHLLVEVPDLAAVAERFTGIPPTIQPRIVQRDGRDVILLPDEP
ncbi:MAG TPA: hypothetical protein VFU88_04165 [Ktedonobacterales bacterium]|nr:hypothetical protein [Ktedonobacterales bacterium]